MILYDHIHKIRKQKHVAGIKNIPKRSKIDLSTHTHTYIHIYIYIWYPLKKPMQTSILLVFTVNFIYFGTDFVPIKFEAPTVGKLKN